MLKMPAEMPTAASEPKSEAHLRRQRSRSSLFAMAAVVVAILVAAAGLFLYYRSPMPPSQKTLVEGGFTEGQVVTFIYNGTNNYLCTPGLLTFFPNASQAAASTPCEAGAASQNAVLQYPEWILVPAFAGLSIFGFKNLGASASGFPQFRSSVLLTDCGAGLTTTACVDHPARLYSPLFTAVERFLNISTGLNGLPEGVLPTPSHDHLLNTSATFPNVEWGTIVVFVLDPNIWPDRATGTCTLSVASDLVTPTANCLTSISGLVDALGTHSTAVGTANHGNPLWQTFGAPTAQVIVPEDLTVAEINDLNANLYIPFAVQPGATTTVFPT